MSWDQPVVEECVNHPGYAAEGHCPRCGQALCAVCLGAHGQDPERYCPAAVPPLPEPARRSPGATMGLIAAILALCIVALVVAGVVYSNHQNEPPANTLAAPEPPGPPPPSSAPLAPLAPPATAPAPPPSGTAREEAAQAVALQGKPGWAAVINSHEPDWSQVTVWIGPTKNDLRLARTLIWDPTLRAYALTQEGAVPQPPPTSLPPAPAPAPGPTPAPAPAPAANEPQPDREAALNAALANDPGYEARVVAHSADWKKVTVDTGLPMQPLSHEYRFHWDDNSHQYILDRMGPLGRRRR